MRAGPDQEPPGSLASAPPAAADVSLEAAPPRRYRPVRVVLVAALLLVAAVLGALVGANLYVRARTVGLVIPDAPHAGFADFAIVPGAAVRPDRAPSEVLAARLEAALALFQSGHVTRVLVSGDRHGAYDEPEVMARWLQARGVPITQVVIDPSGFRTLDTMSRAARVFGIRQAVVCTQPLYLPRALFLAERAGIRVFGLAAARDPVSFGFRRREALSTLLAVVDSYVLGP